MVLARSVVVTTFSALALATASPASAQTVVTLEALESRAVTDNASLEARVARIHAAEARVRAVRADMMPRASLDFGVQASPGAINAFPCDRNGDGDTEDPGETCFARGSAAISNDSDANNAVAFRPAVVPSVTVRLEGVLYDFGRTAARVRAAEAEVGAQEADVEAAEESIVRTVRAAYLAWLGSHLRRTGTETSLAVAEQRVTDLTRALAAGARSEADRDGAAIEVARMQLELARARSSEASSRRLLARIVGEPLADDTIPDAALLDRAPPSERSRNEASLRALELRQEASRLGERAYRLRFAPVLSANVSASYGAQLTFPPGGPVDVLQAPSYQAGLALSIPLFDPRARSFLLDEARAQAAALEAAAEDAQIAMDSAELEARSRITETDAEIVLAQAVVDATERAAAGTEERFRVAGGSIDNVLSARERERRAREDLMRSRLDRTDAVLRLLPVR